MAVRRYILPTCLSIGFGRLDRHRARAVTCAEGSNHVTSQQPRLQTTAIRRNGMERYSLPSAALRYLPEAGDVLVYACVQVQRIS